MKTRGLGLILLFQNSLHFQAAAHLGGFFVFAGAVVPAVRTPPGCPVFAAGYFGLDGVGRLVAFA